MLRNFNIAYCNCHRLYKHQYLGVCRFTVFIKVNEPPLHV